MSKSAQRHTKEILSKHNLRTKKKFGQNYLIDDNIISRIIDVAAIDEKTLVIEIGPGLGTLTRHLVEKAGAVLAYEIDDGLIPVLTDMFRDENNFTLIHRDILKADIDKDIESHFPDFEEIVVVANLPYYITTPILFKCLEESNKIDVLVLMTQLEVARRLTAHKNTKDYNALSVLIHYRTDPEFCFKVPRSVFVPSPNVDSAVIRLSLKETDPDIDESFFFDLIKQSFKQRRKTLVNNLHDAYGIGKSEIIDFLETQGIRTDARAESLDTETFVKLSEAFRNKFFT